MTAFLGPAVRSPSACIALNNDNTHSLLEGDQVVWSHGVCFRDDWNEIYSGAEALHDLEIQRFQSIRVENSASCCQSRCRN